MLCNLTTASASVILCAGVQDGKLGTVIGRSPYNSPSFYGSIVRYTLPETQINLQISSGYRKRFDENADQSVFVPDIVTDIYQDSLEFAVKEHFKEEYNAVDWE